MNNEGRKNKPESRIQIPNAPDVVMKMVLMENLGTHLKAALRGRIEIDNASVVAINAGKKAARVSTILTLIAAELEEHIANQSDGEAVSKPVTAPPPPPKTAPVSNEAPSGKVPGKIDPEHFR